MTRSDRRFSPSPEAVDIVKVTLQRMGFTATEADARGLVEAVLAVEGPRLHLQVRGAFENSLEIIRDTAEAALGEVKAPALREKAGGRPIAARRPIEEPQGPDDGQPRPVFKRPRR